MKRALITGISGALLHGWSDPRQATRLIAAYVEADPRLLRSGEIHDLRGDPSLARKDLGWAPSVDFPGLVQMMLAADMAAAGGQLPQPVPRPPAN